MGDGKVATIFFAFLYATFYGFALYSKALKATFGLTQRELVNVNTLPYALGVLSPVWGMVQRRIGLKPQLLLGGLVASSSQIFTYLIATKTFPISAPPGLVLVLMGMCTYIGVCLITSPSFSTPVKHFSEQ